MATFWPSTNPASFRPCSNAVARSSEPAAVVLRRNPITGTADRCARAASGHATTALLKSLVNSRRLMASPAPRTKSGIKRLSRFWAENCAVRRTQAGSQPCPLWVKSRHRRGVRPCWWTGSGGGFDRLLGVVVLILHRAHVAERGVESTRVVDLIDEAWKVGCNVI